MSESHRPDAGEMRYRDALHELREILEGIEREEVDLDELSEKVERAASLIRTCRERIERTELRVQRVLEDLQPAAPPDENQQE
ncbi:MAG: exodeoxyribonuclease VII small subunit [Myxococcota bacterium]